MAQCAIRIGNRGLRMKVTTVMVMSITAMVAPDAAPADSIPLLVLEAKIPLDHIRGRIDHLAIDLARQRLYVAELGNNTVGVVDLRAQTPIRTLSGFSEPQGVGYEPTTDTLYVANGGDGTVQLFQGAGLTPVGKISLGDDADNVRVDGLAHRVLVGYGSGALAVIDPNSRKKTADIPLKAHPESFQIDRSGQHIFINVPEANEVAVADRTKNQQTGAWSPEGLHANFPLAIDEVREQVLVVYRHPSKLGAFNARSGLKLSTVDTCGDADDVFVDAKRSLVYVSCGEGYIDVLVAQGNGYLKVAQIRTAGGARTALFVPEMDRYFLAVRANAHESAAIWVFHPAP